MRSTNLPQVLFGSSSLLGAVFRKELWCPRSVSFTPWQRRMSTTVNSHYTVEHVCACNDYRDHVTFRDPVQGSNRRILTCYDSQNEAVRMTSLSPPMSHHIFSHNFYFPEKFTLEDRIKPQYKFAQLVQWCYEDHNPGRLVGGSFTGQFWFFRHNILYVSYTKIPKRPKNYTKVKMPFHTKQRPTLMLAGGFSADESKIENFNSTYLNVRN